VPSSASKPFNPWQPAIPGENIMKILVRAPNRRRFAAFLDGHVLCDSRTPLLAAARVLQAKGITGDTLLEMIHERSTVVALRSTVGEEASLRVNETGCTPRFVPWRPDQLPSMAVPFVPLRPQTEWHSI
jgi:hypothetical protein